MHPLTGAWIANVSKSHRHANHQFQNATMRFNVSGYAVSLTYEGVNASGQHEGSTRKMDADGQERPVPEAAGVVAISTIGPLGLESIGKEAGTLIGRSTYEVSDDGQTLTATVSGIDGSGEQDLRRRRRRGPARAGRRHFSRRELG